MALLIGEKAQRTAFARVMVQMKDESVMAAIHGNNKDIFEPEMCKRILNSVPRLAIYQGDARSYENELWYTLRDDIESRLEEKGDHSVIEQLLWLKRQDDLSVTLENYLELARKLLSDMHLGSVRYLLTDFMRTNLSQAEGAVITAKEAEARLPIHDDLRFTAPSFEQEVKLIAALRERDRILKLVSVLEMKERVRLRDLDQKALEQLKVDCWELIKSKVLPGPGLLVADCNDVLRYAVISGDEIR